MWFQHPREKWLISGDRDTRYYHLKAVDRKRKNNVLLLRNDQGEWIEDTSQLNHLQWSTLF